MYDKHCLHLSQEEIQANLDAGKPYVIRMNMPTEGTTTFVDELYGDTKDEEWKKEEVARLKAEQGITDEEEPALKLEGEMINEGNSGEESLPDVEEQGNEPA